MQQHLEKSVGVYNGLNSSQPAYTTQLNNLYDLIQGLPSQLPPLKDVTAVQARMLELGSKDFTEYKDCKKAAYNCAFSFTAGHTRSAKEAKQYDNSAIHTGLVNFDCDNETLELIQRIQAFESICKELLGLYFIDFAARSLSAPLMGSFWLNALVEMPASFDALPYGIAKHLNRKTWVKDLHKLFYLAVKHLLTEALGYDIIGGASHDVTRVRTTLKDTGAYRNTNTRALSLSTLLELLESGKVKPFKAAKSLTVGTINKAFAVNDVQEQKALSIAVSQLQSRPNPCLWVDGNHHNFQFELSVILNRLGVPQDSATRLILANYPRRSFGGLGNAVTSAYTKTEFHGIENYLLENCAPTYTFTLSKGETISNFAKEISSILESDRAVIMKAPTGTGKSHAVTNAIADHFVKQGKVCVFVAPTNILATQTAGANIPLITGESLKDLESFEGIEAQILECGKVSVNQNQFPNLFRVLKSKGLEIACFIDECDTLISGCFKHQNQNERLIMLDVQRALDGCDYKLLYSATPYLFDHYTKPKYTFIDIQQESRPAINLITHKCKWKNELDVIKDIMQFIANESKPNNILLIRINNKDLINAVYTALMSLFQMEQVVKIYSSDDVKETADFQRLAHGLATNNSFFDGVRIVLCTGLIDCGLSIYECEREIISAYFEPKELDTISLVQFADRHRTSKEKTIHYFYKECTLQSGIDALQSEIEALQATINDLEGKDTIVLNMKLIELKDTLQTKQEILSRYQTNYDLNGLYRFKLAHTLKAAKAYSLNLFQSFTPSDDNDSLMQYDSNLKRFIVCRFAVAYKVACMAKKYNTIEKLLQSLPSYFKVSTGATIEANELNTNLATAGQQIEKDSIAEAENLTVNALFAINGKDIQSNSTAPQFIAYISRLKPSNRLKVYSSNVVLHLDQINALASQYKPLDKHLDLVKGICERYTIASPYPIERKTVKSLVLQSPERFKLSSERLYNYFNIFLKDKYSPIDNLKALYLSAIDLFLDRCLENNVTFTLSELSDYTAKTIRDKARLSHKVKLYTGKELMQLVKSVYVVEKAGRYDLKPVRSIELDNIKDLI